MTMWTVTDTTGVDATWTAVDRAGLRAGLAARFDMDDADVAAAVDRLAARAGIDCTDDDAAYLGVRLT